jgi:hypothetical protein
MNWFYETNNLAESAPVSDSVLRQVLLATSSDFLKMYF